MLKRIHILYEILATLGAYGRGPGDVEWVGSADGALAIDWNTFAEVLSKVDIVPDPSGDYPQLARDLVIAGHGWFMDRPSGRWTLHEIPERQAECQDFHQVVCSNPAQPLLRHADIGLEPPKYPEPLYDPYKLWRETVVQISNDSCILPLDCRCVACQPVPEPVP